VSRQRRKNLPSAVTETRTAPDLDTSTEKGKPVVAYVVDPVTTIGTKVEFESSKSSEPQHAIGDPTMQNVNTVRCNR
jgi:hypothetical protein